MTTSINNVTPDNTVKVSTLSNDTKKKLEALGISATDGMTETEALKKIANAKADKNTPVSPQEEADDSSEVELMADVKTLAARVGVSVASNAEISEILDDISIELEAMLENAENNPSILSQVSTYLTELTNLDAQYDELASFQNNMFSSMEMNATNNKLALGL